jgi:predicted PurR-regulated permease PerM
MADTRCPDDDGEDGLAQWKYDPGGKQLLNWLTAIGVALGGLFGIAGLFVLDRASAFFIPVILAHLLDRLFSPIVRSGRRMGIPPPLGAALVVAVFLATLGGGVYSLSGPATEWIESAPQKMKVAEYKLRGVTKPLETVQQAAEEVDEAARSEKGEAQAVRIQEDQSLGGILLDQTRAFISGLLITIFLLYFLLASGDLLLRKIVRLLPVFHHRKKAVRILRCIERDLSHYLGMVVLINIGLGLAVGGAMALIGMPNPMLWGALAGLLNFVPYLGPAINITVVGLVALVSFEGTGQALLAPLAYLVLNGIEASLITPVAMGWRLQLNRVVIFIALTFWTWIWGIPGALLAVPLLATAKITCDRVALLRPIGDLLGQ